MGENDQMKTGGDQVSQAILRADAASVPDVQDKSAYYGELYERYATDVLRMCYFYLGDRARAEDVCQDVFVKLMTTDHDLQ